MCTSLAIENRNKEVGHVNPFIDNQPNQSNNPYDVQPSVKTSNPSLLDQYNNNTHVGQDILCNRQLDTVNSRHIPSSSLENRMMDRDSLFNMDTRTSVYDPHGMNDQLFRRTMKPQYGQDQTGEITGISYDMNLDETEGMPGISGMPLRSDIDGGFNRSESQNPQLDFQLYNEQSLLQVSHFDPSMSFNSGESQFANVDMDNSLLPKQKKKQNPLFIFSNIANSYSWRQLKQFQDNLPPNSKLVLSPYSILSALIVLYRAAKGNTQLELQQYFDFVDKEQTFNSAMAVNKMINNMPFIISDNSIYIAKEFPVHQSFQNYAFNLASIDRFDITKPNNEVKRINTEIQQKCRGALKGVLSVNSINSLTRMLILNNVYFRCQWKVPFNKAFTKPAPFSIGGTPKKKVFMMHLTGKKMGYFEDNINQVLEMPLNDISFAMGFVLPKEPTQTPTLTNEQYLQYTGNLQVMDIESIYIPRFKHENKFRVDEALRMNGIKNLFSNADLTDMTPLNNQFRLSEIIHQTVIVVDEGGSSTESVQQPNYIMPNIRQGVEFVANHPFIFYVRHIPSNSTIINGIYS
jgi:serine protease inhibitor